MTVTESLHEYLDSLPPTTFSGWRLYDVMLARTGHKTYPGVLLDKSREYCKLSGATLICVDKRRSIYEYTPGAKIAGAIID
jgi:alpha-D-ribose 1-methylphosphonate 5-triphosphate synthase subunit PhnL